MQISRRSSRGTIDRPTLLSVMNDVCVRRLLHTYVAVHGGTFDAPEKHALRAFLDAKQATQGESGGELGIDADELRALESALA